MESPCCIHQVGILVSVHCLTLLDKQALYLLVAQGKLPFTLRYPVKYFLTTTLRAAESLLVPTALELVNNSTNYKQTLAVKGAPLRSCPTGSQSKGHPARVGVLSPTSVNPVFYKLGLQPLTKEDIKTLYSCLPERTLDFLFSPWATYCEIFHTHKPMGLSSGGLNNVNLR